MNPRYQPCGCLTNNAGAHRGSCPVYETVETPGADSWWRLRPATECRCTGLVHYGSATEPGSHDPGCPVGGTPEEGQ